MKTISILSLFMILQAGCKKEEISNHYNSIPNLPTDENTTVEEPDITPLGCPRGYVRVPAGNSGHVSADFCVMKYEARNDGFNEISYSSAHYPWVNIPAQAAKDQCRLLGEDYDLISNDEWMVIALNIEANIQNWSGGALYAGQLNKGHSDSVPALALNISDTTNFYDQTGNTTNNQKRIHILSNGELIWDLAGNVKELVDWSDASTYTLPPACAGSSSMSLFNLSVTCPTTWSDLSTHRPLNPANTNYYGSVSAISTPGFGIVLARGGTFSTSSVAGLLGIDLQWENINRFDDWTGFRCVFRGL